MFIELVNVHKGQNKKQTSAKYAKFFDLCPLFPEVFQLKMVEISRRRKFVWKKQSWTQIILVANLFGFWQNSCQNRKTTDVWIKKILSFGMPIIFLQPVTKYFPKSNRIWETSRKCWYLLFRKISPLLSKINFWRVDWTVAFVSNQFLRFPFPFLLKPCIKFVYSRIQVPFYLWWINLSQKHRKWQKDYVTNCRDLCLFDISHAAKNIFCSNFYNRKAKKL